MLVGLKRISTALGILAAAAAVAQAQGVAPGANQATADSVAATLGTSPGLMGHRIEIEARSGQVTLTGAVASPAHKAEALARTRSVPGVLLVVDRLAVVGDSRVRPAQYQLARGGQFGRGGVADGGTVISEGAPVTSGGVVAGPTAGPLPEGPAGMAGGTQAAVPRYPNHAWPSYAPYPNFSAVGYPTAYPWQAWPNIGPPHPYPEVPLDWRAVTLRWDNGIWWLDFKKNYTRPFFTPYPFGLFAY
jgi:BON domain